MKFSSYLSSKYVSTVVISSLMTSLALADGPGVQPPIQVLPPPQIQMPIPQNQYINITVDYDDRKVIRSDRGFIRLNLMSLVTKELQRSGYSDLVDSYNVVEMSVAAKSRQGEGQIRLCEYNLPLNQRSTCKRILTHYMLAGAVNAFDDSGVWNTYPVYNALQPMPLPLDLELFGHVRLRSISLTLEPLNGGSNQGLVGGPVLSQNDVSGVIGGIAGGIAGSVIGGPVNSQSNIPDMPTTTLQVPQTSQPVQTVPVVQNFEPNIGFPPPPAQAYNQNLPPFLRHVNVVSNFGRHVNIGAQAKFHNTVIGRNTQQTIFTENAVFENFYWINLSALNNAVVVERITVRCLDLRGYDVSFMASNRGLIVENILLRSNAPPLTLPVSRDCRYIQAVQITGYSPKASGSRGQIAVSLN